MTKKQLLNAFQNELQSKFNGAQNWWTKSLFHFTDINNAISILNKEVLYSRDKANSLSIMKNDNANDEVIGITDSEYKKYVRLYFAPLTPTQYNSEGIKPKELIKNNAHCPIPVMFVFDFVKIFMHEGVKFTDGNLATNPIIYDDIQDLLKLDFNLIYHRSWFYPEERDKIVNARHSEVLVKNELVLYDNLRVVIVRSEAEKESLLYQLSPKIREKYISKIFIQPQTGIFRNDWLYINKVFLLNNKIYIDWHICSNIEICKNKYTLKIIAKTPDNSIVKTLIKPNWHPMSNLQKINLPQDLINKVFRLEVYIDNIRAYYNLLGY